MAIHCHSARYHYDSFHSRGGDIINIGSNNTYNIGGYGASIWGNGGSFWGGFGTSLGWGLGQGLMNWLGNGLNGGGWNPAGIFGGGMGFGINPWQQMSTFSWGGSTGRGGSASGTTDSSSHKDCVDSDRQLINQLGSKVINLQGKPDATREDAVKLYKEIAKAKENTNDIHKATDQKDYDNWMNVLNNYAKSKGWGDLNSTDASALAAPATQTTPAATPTTPTTPVATTPDGAGDAGNEGSTGTTPAQTTGSEPWSGVTNWGTNTLANKDNINLPSGYSKISDNDNITEVKVTREIAGKMKDINGNSCQLSTEKVKKAGKDSNLPMYIAITSSESGKVFKYKYVGTTADGNPVYATPESDSNKNVYILAKKGDSFELIQLAGFSGHKRSDKQNG